MNRILNSVVIAIVAFFGFLAVFTFSGLPSASGEEAPSASLSLVTAQWAKGGDGTQIEVRLVVHNQGNVAQAQAITYETTVDGTTFDEGTVAVDDRLPISRDADFTFTTDLGSAFASRWWPAHAAAGGDTTMTIRGALEIREAGVDRSLPFEWTSPWTGMTTDLFTSLADCSDPSAPACLDGAHADWDGDSLRVSLTVRNQGSYDLRVGRGDVGLVFGGHAVATGEADPTDIPAGGRAEVEVVLDFDGDGLDAWWPGHVRRCEDSPAQVSVSLELEDAYGWPLGTASWLTPEAPLRTAFLCNGGPA